jgi:hypothetical protein
VEQAAEQRLPATALQPVAHLPSVATAVQVRSTLLQLLAPFLEAVVVA